jgi:hypothetical protein
VSQIGLDIGVLRPMIGVMDSPPHEKRPQMAVRRHTNTDVIEDLARRTARPVELVKELYEDEVRKLEAGATVQNYIALIAGQRVKQRLLARSRELG